MSSCALFIFLYQQFQCIGKNGYFALIDNPSEYPFTFTRGLLFDTFLIWFQFPQSGIRTALYSE